MIIKTLIGCRRIPEFTGKNWLSETLMRVMIKGKRGRVVLLLPTEEVTDAIDLILNVGEDVG